MKFQNSHSFTSASRLSPRQPDTFSPLYYSIEYAYFHILNSKSYEESLQVLITFIQLAERKTYNTNDQASIKLLNWLQYRTCTTTISSITAHFKLTSLL